MKLSNGFYIQDADQCLVRIDGLELDASIGIYPHEKAERQIIVVNLAWMLSAKPVVQTDDICETIDYDDVVSCIHTLLANQHFNLLETLSHRMIETLQSRFLFERLKVTVSKPAAISEAKSVSVTTVTGLQSTQATKFSAFLEENVLQL